MTGLPLAATERISSTRPTAPPESPSENARIWARSASSPSPEGSRTKRRRRQPRRRADLLPGNIKSKDEGGRRKAEGKAFKSRKHSFHPSAFILSPSALLFLPVNFLSYASGIFILHGKEIAKLC